MKTPEIRESATFTKQEMAVAFPDVDPGHTPYGTRVLIQIRSAKEKSKGGIIMVGNDIEAEKWNTQVGKVISLGPVAFKNRDTLKAWPEKAWCKVGTFVRIPKYNQDRWEVKRDDGTTVLFMLVKDVDLLAEVTCSPLAIKAFI